MKNVFIACLFLLLTFTSSLYAQNAYRTERVYSNYYNSDDPDDLELGVAINSNGIVLGFRDTPVSYPDGFTYFPPALLGSVPDTNPHILVRDINDSKQKVGGCRTSRDLVDFM